MSTPIRPETLNTVADFIRNWSIITTHDPVYSKELACIAQELKCDATDLLSSRIEALEQKLRDVEEQCKREQSLADEACKDAAARRKVMQAIFDEVEGHADGAVDASPHDKLANKIMGMLWNHVTPRPKVNAVPDRWAEEKAAHAAGKVIECRWLQPNRTWSEWKPIQDPLWAPSHEYRVKPDWLPLFDVGQRVKIKHNGNIDTIIEVRTLSAWRDIFFYMMERHGWKYQDEIEPYVWTLPAPPAGQQWHRTDWTEEMLPEGYRPLLHGETIYYHDEFRHANVWDVIASNQQPIATPVLAHFRTKRPLPSAPRVPLGPEDVPPGSVMRHPNWQPAEHVTPSVFTQGVAYPKLRNVAVFSYGELMEHKWQILRPGATEWEPCSKPA